MDIAVNIIIGSILVLAINSIIVIQKYKKPIVYRYELAIISKVLIAAGVTLSILLLVLLLPIYT